MSIYSCEKSSSNDHRTFKPFQSSASTRFRSSLRQSDSKLLLSHLPHSFNELRNKLLQSDSSQFRSSLQTSTSLKRIEVATEVLKKLQTTEQYNKRMQWLRQIKQRMKIIKRKISKLTKNQQTTNFSQTSSNLFILQKKADNTHLIPKQIQPPKPIFNPKQFNYICSYDCFKLLKYIASGGSGKVFIAQNIKSKLFCFIKSIPKASLSKHSKVQLLREIKIQSFLKHPNIIQLYTVQADKNYIHLVLQPFLGKDLHYLLKNEKERGLQEKLVKDIMRQVCKAVQYLHRQNIIHRDIKSQNILIYDNVVKLCDFGWAVHSTEARQTRCGTPIYSSPQIARHQSYDNKIDVWNIGILTYQLLHGVIPFQINNQQDVTKVLYEEVYCSRFLSHEAKEFIEGCLAKDIRKRFSIRQAIQHDFLQNVQKYRWTIE